MADFEGIIKTHVGEDGNIPATAIATMVTAIKTAVGNEYVEKERYKAKLTEIDSLKEQQQTAEDNATTAEKWKDKYSDLKKEFESYKSDQKAKEVLTAKQKAYTDILKDAGITSDKAISKVLKYTDFKAIELDEEGKVKDANDQMKAVKEEWPELISKTTTSGADVSHPPANGGIPRKTKEEIMQIKDTAERQKALREYLTQED